MAKVKEEKPKTDLPKNPNDKSAPGWKPVPQDK